MAMVTAENHKRFEASPQISAAVFVGNDVELVSK